MKSFTFFAVLSAFYAMSASAACTQPSENIFVPSDQLTNLSLKQDSSLGSSNATNSTGRKISSTFSWIKVWYSSNESDTVGSIRDIKIAFPTHDDALNYVALSPHEFSEGAPQVEQYQYKGTTVTVYGPRPPGMSLGAAMGATIPPITAYVYVSVAENVISKVFVMQGLEATTALTPDRGKTYANAAIDNIAVACK